MSLKLAIIYETGHQAVFTQVLGRNRRVRWQAGNIKNLETKGNVQNEDKTYNARQKNKMLLQNYFAVRLSGRFFF